MDFELGHAFDSSHPFKPNNLATMENQMRGKYQSDYHDQGLAFAPLDGNSLGQLGPDFQNFLWTLADHAAKNHFSANLLDKKVSGLPDSCHRTRQPSGNNTVSFTGKLLTRVWQPFSRV
jgi:hypothetical protein